MLKSHLYFVIRLYDVHAIYLKASYSISKHNHINSGVQISNNPPKKHKTNTAEAK